MRRSAVELATRKAAVRLIDFKAASCEKSSMEIGFGLGSELRRNRLVFGAMVLIAGIFWLTRSPPPPVTIVNGVYSNACCRPLSVRDGAFLTGSGRVQFTLRNMKFGLEAMPDRNLTVEDGRVQVSDADDTHRTYIEFDDDRRGFTLLGPSMRQFHFRR